MGAHVSDCPNHTVGRATPFATRGHVALAGTFGYELDITAISESDRMAIKGQTLMYHKYHSLVREGDYYRIASWQDNHKYDCWEIVSKDKREALVTFVQVLAEANYKSRKIRLRGLDPNALYRLEDNGMLYSVAQRLNVSTVTVSNALAGQKGVSEELRDKIITTAAEMGYQTQQGPVVADKYKALNIGVIISEKYLGDYPSFYWKVYQELCMAAKVKNCMILYEVLNLDDERDFAMPLFVQEKRQRRWSSSGKSALII